MAKRRYQPNPALEAVSAYRDRFRRWTMEALPSMSDDEWDRLVAWVHAFGFQPGSPHGKNAAKRFAREITATVTERRQELEDQFGPPPTVRRRKVGARRVGESVRILYRQQRRA